MNKKYPISVNKQQCIGPCYSSGVNFVHPLTLEETVRNHNTCPVNTFLHTDKKTGKTYIESFDDCYIPTSTQATEEGLENIVTPEYNFSSEIFIKLFYKINNIQEFLTWLNDNKDELYTTRKRVFNHCMVTFGDDLTIIDQHLVSFVDLIMFKNISKINNRIKKYIVIDGDNVLLSDTFNDKQFNKNDINMINQYIKDTFLGRDNIHVFLVKFIKYFKDRLTDRFLSKILVKHMIDNIIKKIKLTIEQKL